MGKVGIIGAGLSNNQSMEQQQNNQVTLSPKEAEEYCAYKRQKKIAEIMSAMRRSESVLTGNDNAAKTCERASRLKQSAVRMTPTDMLHRGEVFVKNGVKIDCIIGGNGETFSAVKAFEAKQARKAGARELTFVLTPSLIANCRYTEIKKELKNLRKAVGKTVWKVRLERGYPSATLSRIARLCSEAGAHYLSMPYFAGCEGVQAELSGGCLLEVSGVDNLADFKKMAGAGTCRTISPRIWEIYTEWLAEADQAASVCLSRPT